MGEKDAQKGSAWSRKDMAGSMTMNGSMMKTTMRNMMKNRGSTAAA